MNNEMKKEQIIEQLKNKDTREDLLKEMIKIRRDEGINVNVRFEGEKIFFTYGKLESETTFEKFLELFLEEK